jgi:hypothetical protein
LPFQLALHGFVNSMTVVGWRVSWAISLCVLTDDGYGNGEKRCMEQSLMGSKCYGPRVGVEMMHKAGQ